MINRVGLAGLTKNLSSPPPLNRGNTSPTYVTGRVLDIILDENHPDFSTQGEWNSIGTIQFKIVSSDNVGNIILIVSLISLFLIVKNLYIIYK